MAVEDKVFVHFLPVFISVILIQKCQINPLWCSRGERSQERWALLELIADAVKFFGGVSGPSKL